MAITESWFKQDLKKPVIQRYIVGNFFSLDNVGNLVGVKVYDDGDEATLSGSVTGYCTLVDGTTVPVSGTRSGNQAYILLPQSVLSITGPIGIVLKLTDGNTITTLLSIIATVYPSQTDTVIIPSSQVITDWAQQINTALQNVVDASAAQDEKIYSLESEIARRGIPSGGASGQSLRKKSGTNYDLEWADVGLPTDAQTAAAVSDWLDNHPEATTTVQDGSLTKQKFTDELKKQTLNDYVTPQMFGASGDGQTDDSVAFNDCIVYAILNKKSVYIPSGTYVCNIIIDVDDIFGEEITQSLCSLNLTIAGAGESTILTCGEYSDYIISIAGKISENKNLLARYITLSSLNLQGNGSCGAIKMIACQQVKIYDIISYNCTKGFLTFVGVMDADIDGLNVIRGGSSATGDYAVSYKTAYMADGTTIHNTCNAIKMTNSRFETTGCGFYITGTNNIFTNVKYEKAITNTTEHRPMVFGNANEIIFSNCFFVNNTYDAEYTTPLDGKYFIDREYNTSDLIYYSQNIIFDACSFETNGGRSATLWAKGNMISFINCDIGGCYGNDTDLRCFDFGDDCKLLNCVVTFYQNSNLINLAGNNNIINIMLVSAVQGWSGDIIALSENASNNTVIIAGKNRLPGNMKIYDDDAKNNYISAGRYVEQYTAGTTGYIAKTYFADVMLLTDISSIRYIYQTYNGQKLRILNLANGISTLYPNGNIDIANSVSISKGGFVDLVYYDGYWRFESNRTTKVSTITLNVTLGSNGDFTTNLSADIVLISALCTSNNNVILQPFILNDVWRLQAISMVSRDKMASGTSLTVKVNYTAK